MTTANQILAQSLGLLGIRAPGEALDGAVAADCLDRLNTMLDGWRLEAMFATASVRVTATLDAATTTATIGPTGTFVVTPRPIQIEPGSFFTVGSIDYPIDPIAAEEFNSIALKQTQTLGPSSVYFEAGDPNGTLYFYPQLASSAVVTLLVMGHLANFADLTTNYTLAPGVQRALTYSFAEEMEADFERPLAPGAKKIAAISRRTLKRSRHVVPQLNAPRYSGLGPDYLASAAATFQSAYADNYADNYA